jgi:hypothetical protein
MEDRRKEGDEEVGRKGGRGGREREEGRRRKGGKGKERGRYFTLLFTKAVL